MQERRRSSRVRAFLAGRIAYDRGRSALDCVVRDLSADGARLLLDEPLRAPRDFDLAVTPGGEMRRARVVWRGERGVGVAFAAGVEAGAPGTVVSIAAFRRARTATGPDRLAERVAQVSHPAPRGRAPWAPPDAVE